MKGQFFIIATFLLILSLSTVLQMLYHFPRFDFQIERVFFFSGMRYLPRKVSTSCFELEIYNFRKEYEGPLIIELKNYFPLNSKDSFTIILDKPYLIVFSRFKVGESKIFRCDKEREMRFFGRGDCIETRNYSICKGYLDLGSGKLSFDFDLKDWGDVYIGFDGGVFLPNSILIFSIKNLTVTGFNYTKLSDGYYFYNQNDHFYLIGKVDRIGDNFRVVKGIIFFGDLDSARMAYYQDFYLKDLRISYGSVEDKTICYENGIECRNYREREYPGYLECYKDSKYYNFITRISNKTIGWGEYCYSLRGIEGASEYSPLWAGRIGKKYKVRVFDKEYIFTSCEKIPWEWYSGRYLKGANPYVDLGNVSGDFKITVNSTEDFWINISSGVYYMLYPETRKYNSSERFFEYNAKFLVNSSVNDLKIPSYSILSGTVNNLKRFYSRGPTKVKCAYCNVKVYNGPIEMYDEIVSEKTYYLNGSYVVCNPSCNVTSDFITFFNEYTFCPPHPKILLRSIYLLNSSFDYTLNISDSPFSISGVRICIDGSCSSHVYRGADIYFFSISNCTGVILCGDGYIHCPGIHNINFSEIPLEFEDSLKFDKKFLIRGKISKISQSNYKFKDYLEIFFYNSACFSISVDQNSYEILGRNFILR